ncbi:MAG: hypothetical protein KDA24_17525 [Deltaproteobacteria bacterium]|nr:hypothetical protein [Deltaproteobacteria bacterium]
MRVRLDKIASSTRNAKLHRDVVVGGPIPAVAGTVVAVRVLDNKAVYNKIEDPHGRLVQVQEGDVLAGVLGARDALRGYAGEVPKAVAAGDILHLLNLGGVIGLCTSVNPDVGPPCRVEVLGAVMRFPELGRRVGVPASIAPGPVAPRDDLPADLPPLILVAGSCMHAGKTAAACALVRAASRRGLQVAATKVTGVALRRDSLEMMDHGAVDAVTFVDTGIPSTAAATGVDVAAIAKGCIAAVAKPGIDIVVVELGDGLLGRYGVDAILDDAVLKAQRGALVFAANDPVAAWGGVNWLDAHGWRPVAVTGPATDNEAGSSRIEELCSIPALNARTRADGLADLVLSSLETGATGSIVPDAAAS